jgi:hypothetical protein
MIDQILKAITQKEGTESNQTLKLLGVQALMGMVQTSTTVTSRVSNKLLNELIDEMFSIKNRHKVLHV